MPGLGSGHHWADYSFTLTASVSLLMSEAKGARLAFRHSASLWSCTVNDICPESVLYNQEKKKWISLGLEIFMEMSYLVWCLGIFDLVSKIIWITRVTDTNTAPKDGPSERPEGGNLGTTFKEKPKRKAWKACPTAVPHITPVLPPYMAPTTG